jgi:hypothetical protein
VGFAAIDKYKKLSAGRIFLQVIGYERNQSIERFSDIHGLGAQPNRVRRLWQ